MIRIFRERKFFSNISRMSTKNYSILRHSLIQKIKKRKLKIIFGKSQSDKVADWKAKSKSSIRLLSKTRRDLMIFKFVFLEPTKKLSRLSWSWIGIRNNFNNGQLLESKKKKITWPYKNIERKMMPKLENLTCKFKN